MVVRLLDEPAVWKKRAGREKTKPVACLVSQAL
jgi:hypothetical protein